ncbi:MAG: fused MFS/spermidine synthase [Bacteroidales bacterium]|nr:fused MFS/spermidine synthase [Bacteroidales bacterium]
MPVLFAITLFISANLLFMVQPMVGKMILPLLGGSPAAWNTCMVFFQGLLLLGYWYAHKLTETHLENPGKQVKIHLGVLGATIFWLIAMAILSPNHSPVAIFQSIAPQGEAYPMFGVLMLLGVAIGLPFLVISTSAPLLQRWFVYTGHPSAKDPYFLYAASNAGSLISLLGYPLVIEPSLSLKTQAWVWAAGFTVLTALVYRCGRAASDPMGMGAQLGTQAKTARAAAPRTPPPLLRTRLRWIALAFVPSSLMLGVTFHMTTDIASVPLLWVIPLALYLLTFIIAFAHTPSWFRPILGNTAPVLILLLVFVMTSNIPGLSIFMMLGLHLVTYFFTALLMHSELARLRPAPEHLTTYFLLISVGGVLGGIFNALIAPVAFPLDWEYPIALAVACLLVPPLLDEIQAEYPETAPQTALGRWRPRMLNVLIPAAMLALTAWLVLLPEKFEWFNHACVWSADHLTSLIQYCGLKQHVSARTLAILLIYAMPCMLCFLFIDRPIRFGLCVAAVLLSSHVHEFKQDAALASARSFFGILKVQEFGEKRTLMLLTAADPDDPEGKPNVFSLQKPMYYHKLMHGTTLHGTQAVDGQTLTQPLTDLSGAGYLSRRSANIWHSEAVLRDDLRLLGSATPWDTVLLAGLQQSWDFGQEPLTYYHRTGPVGEIFAEFRSRHPLGDVAMIGLGTGSVAAYARPGQSLTFYEIDPTVLDIVVEPKVMNPEAVAQGQPPIHGPFTFVDDAKKRGAKIDFILGDARLKLEQNRAARYGLLLVDAFSSDSIPVHLLTREAVELYRDRVPDDGLIAIHISNRYINLEPVVAILAQETGLVGRVWNDRAEDYPGKTASSWIILAKSEAQLGELGAYRADTGFGALAGMAAWNTFRPWEPFRVDPNVHAWTDDYSDVLRVIQLREVRAVRKFLGLPVAGESEE